VGSFSDDGFRAGGVAVQPRARGVAAGVARSMPFSGSAHEARSRAGVCEWMAWGVRFVCVLVF
jgi:hypothetical protein